MTEQHKSSAGWRTGHEKLYRIIFESHEGPSKVFDIALLVTILVSVVVVLLESVPTLDARFRLFFEGLEWVITILFTIEYAIRLRIVRRPTQYAFSFFGIVDVLSLLPTWIGFFFPALGWLQVVRALRLIRVFRILGLRQFHREAKGLVRVCGQQRENHSFYDRNHDYRDHCGCFDVHHRGSGPRLSVDSRGNVLGHRNHEYRGIRRHRAPHDVWPALGESPDFSRLQLDRGPRDHCHHRNPKNEEGKTLPAVWNRGAAFVGALLHAVWRAV